ncbi:uncharacterized protein [Palaemon carinicauda]|uniref:uncharacterized protein n=1 Tax=Palaemon carinicauda TaxID=392227 RepID=UPI0035B5A7B0
MVCLRSPYALPLLLLFVISPIGLDAEHTRHRREPQKTKLPEDTYAVYNFDFKGHPSEIPGFIIPDPLSIPAPYELFSEFPYTMKISNTEFCGLSNLDIVYSEVDFLDLSFHAAINVPEVIVLGNITIITDLLYTTSYWSSQYNITVNGTAIILKGNIVLDEEGVPQLNNKDMLFEIAYAHVELQAENLPFWAEVLIEDSADMFRITLQNMIKDWAPEYFSQAINTEFSMKFEDSEDLIENVRVKPSVRFSFLGSTQNYVKKLRLSKILHCYDLSLQAENTRYWSRNSELTYKDNIIRMTYETEVELVKVTGTCKLLFLKPIALEIELHNVLTESEVLYHTRRLNLPTMREIRKEIGRIVLTRPNLGEVNRSARSSIKDIPQKIWSAIQAKILRKEHWMSLDSQVNSLQINYVVSNRLITRG